MPHSMVSTKAKLKEGHADPVRGILHSYDLRGVLIDVREEDGSWTVQVKDDHDPDWEHDWGAGEEAPDAWEFPAALKRERLPSKEQFPDEEKWARPSMGFSSGTA